MDYCNATYGTSLATIKDDYDAQTILDLFQQDGEYWVGLYDYTGAGDGAGGWAWASGYPWFVIFRTLCTYIARLYLDSALRIVMCAATLSVMGMTAAH